MKKLLSVMLACLFVVSILPLSAITVGAATYLGTCGDNLTWEFDESTGKLTISGTGEMEDYDYSYEPPWYDYSYVITSVELPDGLKSIGDSAFEDCTELTKITIPNSVTSIGEDSFAGCTGLTEITIPNSVTSIGDWAFHGCTNLKTVNNYSALPIVKGNGVSGYAGYYADTVNWFYTGTINGTCGYNLTWDFNKDTYKLTISGTGNMEDYDYDEPWYDYNYVITSVELPDGLTSICNSAFEYCEGLTEITIPNSVTSIGCGAFAYCIGLTEITIGNSVTNIGDYAFYDCTGLTEITIPDSVTSIGDGAFHGCTGLTEITIPDSVTNIGDWAFSSCYGLTEITIGNSVTNIGSHAFEDCIGLTEITIPNSVTSIGDYAFSSCYGLTEITIPDSVTSIGDCAFYDCYGLTEITIGNSVTSIGGHAFSSCYGLTEITIPNSVTSIGDWAFAGCNNLTIYGFSEYVQNYANRDGIPFVMLTNLDTPIPKAVNVSNSINISWERIKNAQKYHVYKSTYSNGKWSPFTYFKGTTGLSVTDTSVSNCSYVKYQVRAIYDDIKSEFGTTSTIRRLSTPTVTTTNITAGVNVKWNKISGAQKYYVYKRTLVNGKWTAWKYFKGTTSGTSITDTTLASGTYVQYQVRAIDRSYTSAYGVTATQKRLANPKATLTKATNGVKVSWGKVTGAQKYYVYRCEYRNGWGSWTYAGGTTGTYFTDTKAPKGVTVKYYVRAVDRTYTSSYVPTSTIRA